MSDPIVTFDRVAIGYAGHPIVSDLSLAVERGSFTALLGANGAGKSTLLKTLTDLLAPVSGRVTVKPAGGKRRLAVGYVPQSEVLDPMFLFTGFEVALMGCLARNRPGRFLPKAERDWTRECLRRTGAADLERKRFSTLSGGQKQRVLIARALAVKPEILVLDEPTAGLDAAAVKGVLDLLRQLHRQEHLTMVMVSHELDEMRAVAEQVLWLHRGRLLQGSVDTMLSAERIQQLLEFTLA